MDERHTKIFQAIAGGIKNNRRHREDVATGECIAALEKVVRPVIRQAAEDIATSDKDIDFNADREPYNIKVHSNELRFACRGDSVKIIMNTGSTPAVDIVKTKDLTEELVFEKVVCFFRWVYNLSPKS
jgi:hypothetical protein